MNQCHGQICEQGLGICKLGELGRAELLCVSEGDATYSSKVPWERRGRPEMAGGGGGSYASPGKGWGKT